MIRIEALRKSFGKRAILKGLDLELRSGIITGIAGPNACGKTTLIKCILGLVVPDSGSIKVLDEEVSRDFSYRENIGYMPQNPDFPANLSLKELLAMLEDLRGRSAPKKSELIEHFELDPILKQPFGQLSGGTKQKVAAVVAFMFDPAILILDEPTAGLDPLSSLRFKELLRTEASRDKTILLVSHVMTEVDQLVNDLLFMVDGTRMFSGELRVLKEMTGHSELERAVTELVRSKEVAAAV